MVPKPGKSTLAALVSGEDIDNHLPTVTSPEGRGNGTFSASFMRAVISFMMAGAP